MKTTTTMYWSNDNGSVVCSDHAGNYLAYAIHLEPLKVVHSTPMGLWELLTDSEVAHLERTFGYSCETCRFNMKEETR